MNMLTSTAIICLAIAGTFALPISNDGNNNIKNKLFLLPETVTPSNYVITIDVTKSLNSPTTTPQTFEGQVDISATIKRETNQITLHSGVQVDTDNVHIYMIGASDVEVFNKTIRTDSEKQFIVLGLTSTLQSGTNIKISIPYKGTFQKDMHGFYVSSYTEGISKEQKYVLTTQFQPTHARKAFPCFDEPKYKATFDITIKKPAGFIAISNMPAMPSSNTSVKFWTTPIMSTYLVAFIVSTFSNNTNSQNLNYKIWARPEAINQTFVAAENVFPIVKNLETFTDIRYDIPKMDMAALPDFSAGAMENWGLLTYRETALLVDDDVSTNRDLQRVVTVIAHEVAHQWFGNLVTLEWWDNTWLNEGFARYFEYHATENVTENWEMKNQFVVEQHQNIFEVDALKKTTPLTLSVYTPEEISSHFGTISYSKGGSVIRMLEHVIGSHVFQKGLQQYLKNRTNSNTVPENLWTDLEQVVKSYNLDLEFTIEKFMSPWISQPGYPVVSVTVDKDGLVSFEQKRFFLNPDENTKSEELWFIPISYTTSAENVFNDTKPQLWLTPNEPKKYFKLFGNESNWFVVNIQQTGYYRVNYNTEHWKRLSYVMNSTGNIHKINRAQIVDDVMNLARAGLVDYDTAFNVTDYLRSETDYFPWYSSFRAFSFLLQRYSENESTGLELRKYLQNLMVSLLSGKSLSDKTGNNTQIEIFNRVNALEWACNLGQTKCVDDAKVLFNKISEVDKNVRTIVYCTAIRYGTQKEWDILWNKYINSNVAAEKVGIINALGCSNDTTILDDYLLKSIENNNIRPQDASYVFSAVYTGGPKGVDAALNFLANKTNIELIKQRYGGMNALEKAALGLASRLTDSKQIDKMNIIIEDPAFKQIKDPAKETTTQNQNWSKAYRTSIEELLKQRNSASNILMNQFVLLLSLGFITVYFRRFN